MEINTISSLEKALAKTESDADAALKAATAAVRSLKKFHAAAQTGNLRELRRTIEAAEQTITALRQQFANAKEGWDFDEETYLFGRAFLSEILEAAEQIGVKIYEQDDRLYCYPFLIRILPNLFHRNGEFHRGPSASNEVLQVLPTNNLQPLLWSHVHGRSLPILS